MPDSYPQMDIKVVRVRTAGNVWPQFGLAIGADGGPVTIEGAGELGQKLEMNLVSILGEYWDGQRVGLRWFDLLGMKPPSLDYLRVEILRELNRHDRVMQVDSLSLDFDEAVRHVSVSANIRTMSGETIKVVIE